MEMDDTGIFYGMRIITPSLMLMAVSFCCCRQEVRPFSFTLDPAIKDTVERHISNVRERRQFSSFDTQVDCRYYLDGILTDSLIDPNFRMLSWYSNRADTIDLVAHIGNFETSALLIRFIKGRPHLFYYRAPHEQQRCFRLNKTDTFSNQVEVPLVRYKLGLSVIPDTARKPPVFGTIEMESAGYYDQRDSVEGKQSVYYKFYFRSSYRNFDKG